MGWAKKGKWKEIPDGTIAVVPASAVDDVTINLNGSDQLQVKPGGLNASHFSAGTAGLGIQFFGTQIRTKQKENHGVFLDSDGLYIVAQGGVELDNDGNVVVDLGATLEFESGAVWDFSSNSGKVTVKTPIDAQDATPKSYVDTLVADSIDAIPADWTKGIQPENEYSGYLTGIFVRTSGNDSTGDGTSLSPFLTLRRSQHEVVQYPSDPEGPLVDIGSGTFVVDGYWNGNGVGWKGARSTAMTGTVSVVTDADAEHGIIIDVTGLNVGLDALRRRSITFTSGTLNGTDGVICKNYATVLGVTTLFLTINRNVILSPNVADTFRINNLLSVLDGSPIFAARNVTVQDCAFTGSSSDLVTIPKGASVSFYNCSFSDIAAIKLDGGRAYFAGCSFYTEGDPNLQMFFGSNANVTIGPGNFFDCTSSPSNNTLLFLASVVDFTGMSVIAGSYGVYFEGCQSVESFNVGTDNALLFEVFDVSNEYGIFVDMLGMAAGSKLRLAQMHGEINGQYAITASRGAYVRFSGGTLTGGGGAMASSADAGLSECYFHTDFTSIVSDTFTFVTSPFYFNAGLLNLDIGAGLWLDGTSLAVNVGNGLQDTGGVISVKVGTGIALSAGSVVADIGNGLTFSGNDIVANIGNGLTFSGGAIVALLGTGLEFNAGAIRADLGNGLGISGNDIVAVLGTGLEFNAGAIRADLGAGLTISGNDIVPNLGNGLEISASAIRAKIGSGLAFSGSTIVSDTAVMATVIALNAAIAALPLFPYGHIEGFRLNWSSGTPAQVTVNLGKARSDDDTTDISTTGNIVVDLSAAAGLNAIDTGSAATDTNYWFWAIYNPTTQTVGIVASLSAFTPTMPSGYTKKVLIGYVWTDSIVASSVREFYMMGDGKSVEMMWPGGLLTTTATNAEASLTITKMAPNATRCPDLYVSLRASAAVAAQSAQILRATGTLAAYVTQPNTASSVCGWMRRGTSTIVVKSTSGSLVATIVVHSARLIRGGL